MIIAFCYAKGVFSPLDNQLYDLLTTLAAKDKRIDHTVIIDIDSDSIKTYGRWPWKRTVFADFFMLLGKKNPSVVGINLLFPDSTPYDEPLIKAVAGLKNVVLGFSQENNTLLFPLDELKKTGSLGEVLFPKDADGIIRAAFTKSVLTNKAYNSFPVEIVRLYKNEAYENIPFQKFLINFKQRNTSFTTISFVEFINNPEKYDLSGKIVIVGLSAEGIAQKFYTPLSGKLETFSNSNQIFAHIIHTILEKNYIFLINKSIVLVLLLLGAIFLQRSLMAQNPFKQALIITGALVFLALSVLILFFKANIYLQPASFMLEIILIPLFFYIFTFYRVDTLINKGLSNFYGLRTSVNSASSDTLENNITHLTSVTGELYKEKKLVKAIIDSLNTPVFLIDNTQTILWKNWHTLENDAFRNIQSLQELESSFSSSLLKSEVNNSYKEKLAFNNRDYLLIVTPVYDDSETYVAILNDISDFTRLDALKNDLMKTLSHQLKTPLTVIQLLADLELQKNADNTDNLSKIMTTTEEMTDLINNFLNLSKLEENLFELGIQKTTLLPVIQSAVDDVHAMAESKKITINIAFTLEETYSISLNARSFKQALINLLSNALKYSDPHKEVLLKVVKHENSVIITVQDQGYGIPKEALTKLFEKFYRVSSDKNRHISGSGLGLSIAKKIMEIHHGEIIIESTLNQGTTVRLVLPDKGIEG